MEQVTINVDDQYINASHYASFKQETAVKRMLHDGITKDKAWAEKTWREARKAVAEKTKPTDAEMEAVADKREEEEKLIELNRTRVATGAEPLNSLDELGKDAPVNNNVVSAQKQNTQAAPPKQDDKGK